VKIPAIYPKENTAFVCAALGGLLLFACDNAPERRRSGAGTGSNQGGMDAAVNNGDLGLGADGGNRGDGGDATTPIVDAGSSMMQPGLAPLAPISDGECPMFGTNSPVNFSSGGQSRRVAVIAPAARPVGMPVLFVWHGLTTLDQRPVEQTISGFNLQSVAEQKQMIIVVAEAMEQSLPFIGNIALWGILGDATSDLTLFDDLRTCIADEYSPDLARVYAWGHSGGALWTSMLLLERSSSLAAVVEFSGGSDFSIMGIGGPFVSYKTPDSLVPALLSTGGMNDVWPEQFALIRFEDTTQNLQDGLVSDGHTVVRCRHDLGHFQLPATAWSLSMDWIEAHRFGEASDFVTSQLPGHSSWCESAQ
jgi:hypothetical protein